MCSAVQTKIDVLVSSCHLGHTQFLKPNKQTWKKQGVFQGVARWSTGSPLTYQQYLSYHLFRDIMFDCKQMYGQTKALDVWRGLPPHHVDSFSCGRSDYKVHYQPTMTTSKLMDTKQCTYMLLTNLADPTWHHIPCKENSLENVVCFLPRNESQILGNIQAVNELICTKGHIIINNMCLHFTWYNNTPNEVTATETPFKSLCATRQMEIVQKDSVSVVDFLHKAISMPPLLFDDPRNLEKVLTLQITKHLNLLTYQYT